MNSIQISILISTKNRCEDLLFTLQKIKPLLNEKVKCVVYDDGSTDTTTEKIRNMFPDVQLKRNETSKGYLYCRNTMLNETQADYAISLDDDAHFLVDNPINLLVNYFEENPRCGLIAARILWTKNKVEFSNSNEEVQTVKSFVGCGHVWRMKAWKTIPNYPEWFEFYGEESFASLQLFKNKWEVHYLPSFLVQHRVDLKERAKNKAQFVFRLRRSLRADWYNYLLFFPLGKALKCICYSIWMQFKTKITRGNLKIIYPIILAVFDLAIAFPKLIKHRNTLTLKEYNKYIKLNEAKVYWKPEK
jgi:glycosyltransferase involved in cell wall biosynthesis